MNREYHHNETGMQKAEESTDFKRGILDQAYDKAVKYHANPENRIYGYDLLPYSESFSPKLIREYNERFRDFNNKLSKKDVQWHEQYSTIQEAMDHEALSKHQWFGQNYESLKMSGVDDKYNITDMVVASRRENAAGKTKIYTALSIDVTNSAKGFKDKIENIFYLSRNAPYLLKNEIFFDPKSNTVGRKVIPAIALFDERENLDLRMANWLNTKAGDELTKKDGTQIDYIAQALFQTLVFSRTCDRNNEDGERLAKYYNRNSYLLKNELIAKMSKLKMIPDTEEVVSILTRASKTNQATIRSLLCKMEDTSNSLLHKAAWGQ